MAINRIRADIDLDAILYNMESMHNKLKPGTMMAAVVRLMAMVMVLRLFQRYWSRFRTCRGYAVATSNEAMQLMQQAEKADTYFRTQLPGAV